jgi:ABC-type transporter Mla subunit MlaD
MPADVVSERRQRSQFERKAGVAARTSSRTRRTSTRKTAGGSRGKQIERVEDAITAAEGALKDLRRDLTKGGQDLLKDVDRTLKDARRNLRGIKKTLAKDLEGVGRSVTGKGRTGARRSAARKPAPRKRTSTAKSR